MRILLLLRLLDDPRVIEEIERYKWIESERIGKDIGLERAAREWIEAYAKIWLKVHKPQFFSFAEAVENAGEIILTPEFA